MPHFSKLISNPFKFRLYLLTKLPAAFFCGVRIVAYDEHVCTTSIKYSWYSKNPFRSIYFAALAMAAEMSTGVLAMGQLYGRKTAVSMLVTHQDAEFIKKARGHIRFTCNEGDEIGKAIQKAIETGAGEQITITSRGENEAGETVAIFSFTWSFKKKSIPNNNP